MHSLVVYRLWANTYRHKEERLDVSNYGNKPLQDYIFSFVNDNNAPFQEMKVNGSFSSILIGK